MARIPSIELIPSAYKSGKVYSVLPTDGSGDLNFARASEATRVNQNGLIEKVGSNVPRIDYTDGGCPSLLLEPATTNLITYSEDFTNVAWASVGSATVSPDVVLSPDGSVNADKIVSASATSVQGLQDDPIFVSGSDYAISVFLKKSEYDWFRINTGSFNSVFTNASAWFNISNGTIGTVESGLEAEIKDYGNGWYRCSVVATASASAVGRINFLLANEDNNNDVIGDGTSGVYIWGAQLEQQSYATSYIPTNGSTVTREAETASKSGLSSYINSQEGVLYLEMSALANDGTSRNITLRGSTGNFIKFIYSANSNRVDFVVFSNSGVSCNIVHNLSDTTDTSKFGLKWKNNDFSFWINGIEVGVDTSGNAPLGDITSLTFTDEGGVNNPFYGKTKALKVYNQALTDLELEEMTGFKSFVQMANQFNYTVI